MFKQGCFSLIPIVLLCVSLFSVSCRVASDGSQPELFSSYDEQVKELLSRMTLEEKIGQMIQTDQEHLRDPADIEKYYIGSILSGGNSDPAEGNSLQAWTDRYDQLQGYALKTRLGIPILYGIDAVHGHSNVLGAVIFPHNIGLGCTRDPELVEKISRITATEMRTTGIQWTFAPCVTVPRDERWGRTYEGFSEDPKLVKVLGEASIRGLQGKDLAAPLSVLACAKHYIGDGGTTAVPGGRRGIRLDQGDTQINEQRLREIHLPPYVTAIEAGVGTIMPSYSSWNGLKCSASRRLLTEILKEELGFEGFIISDYRAIDQVDPDYKTAVGISINAGIDMGMIPSKYREFFTYLKELVEEGVVPVSRIDDAVTRILRVKCAMGLLDKNRSHLAYRGLDNKFGSDEHRQVAREAVRKSLVLLKNEACVLPISKQVSRIHVAGKNADNLGNQCGGWTIGWQGGSGEVTPGGTTILAAIKSTVSDNTKVTFSLDGTDAQGADIGIAVIGERPYAEGSGDNADLALDQGDIEAVDNMRKAGIPVVVILISGRPLIISDVLDEVDAFVAAWLPGTEGQGVADVLFGDYKPTGILSCSWPRSIEQAPINIGDDDYDPLFEYGFGLPYCFK